MVGLCLLCNQKRVLRESHLIPKYIFKWIKETGSGHLRSGENLNLRIQDGPKRRLLCNECENLFSSFETYFAKRIFYPVVNDGASEISYNEKLQQFAISVLWRLVKNDFIPEETDPEYLALLIAAEEDWRNYLLGKQTTYRFSDLHLLCGVDVRNPDEIDQLDVPDRFFHYFARQVDAGVTGNREHKFIYLKLPRMLFIVPIQGFEEGKFRNTTITSSGNTYHLNEAAILEPLIGDYFYKRIQQLNDLFGKISEVQKQKLAELSTQKWDEIKNKDLGIILDYQNRQML